MTVFWRWWAAGTVSRAGSAVTAVALPLTALTGLDATPFQMGLIAAAGGLAWIVIGLPSGVIVQRLPPRGVQVGADLARALAVVSIPLTWWWGRLTILQLVMVALVVNFATVVFEVANLSFLPTIVPTGQLAARNSLNSATEAVTSLGGPAIGGVVVRFVGAAPTLLIDAVSYLVSALLLGTLPGRDRPVSDEWPPMRAMIREGWTFVTRHPVMGPGMWTATAVNTVCGAQAALYPLYLVRELHLSIGLVGLLLGTEGIGTLIGATLATRITTRYGSARTLLVVGIVIVLGAVVIPVGHGWTGALAFAAGNIVFAGGVVVLSVTTRTYRQLASPPALLSRVIATVRFVSWGAIPVGGFFAGLLAEAVGSRTALFVFAGVSLGAPLVLFGSSIRALRNLTDYDDEAALASS